MLLITNKEPLCEGSNVDVKFDLRPKDEVKWNIAI